MKSIPLYQQIVDAVRADLLAGRLRPGDGLPPVRAMAERWRCTPGTVQQAYRTLAEQGLVVSRAGQGTRIGAGALMLPQQPSAASLRHATLVNQAETFLLEVITAGHTVPDVEAAFRTALDRWRAHGEAQAAAPANMSVLRFAGSHDPTVSLLASRFGEICAGCTLDIVFSGSLSGLIALAEDKADMAGSHLWDAESDTYNTQFVRRLLPGRRVALITLVHRRLGLIVPPGNPLDLTAVTDLARPGLRFVQRQRGAGTRVWLETQLRSHGLDPAQIIEPGRAVATHSEVAHLVAEGITDAGLGIENAALAFNLGFVPLAVEPYDLIVPGDRWDLPAVRQLCEWLQGAAAHTAIAALGGYDTTATGEIRWIE